MSLLPWGVPSQTGPQGERLPSRGSSRGSQVTVPLWGQAQAVMMCTLARWLKSGAAGESGQRQDGAERFNHELGVGGTRGGPAPQLSRVGTASVVPISRWGHRATSCSHYVRHLEMSMFLVMIASMGSKCIKNKT